MLPACHQKQTLFTPLFAEQTHINFTNKNQDTDSLNILDYLYYYNGAGVAIGDINNDGLPDIYFASNKGGNKLYLNKGNFNFEDITAKAGVAGIADWTTGVTMADVNADGYLDIYVSTVSNHKNSSGKIFFPHSKNQLFINNGQGRFTENAAAFGLDLQGYNTQAVFLDYDKDGDLDMFQLQHSIHQTDTYGDTSLRSKYSNISGGKMMRNDDGHFTDATKGSGIISSALGYGLGISVADFNNDGWPDMYVGNDFHENDYYYVNQQNGSFLEMNNTAFAHESNFSMGNDAADINHDGWIDLMTLDMLPQNEKVLKSSLGEVPIDEYNNLHAYGYTNQYAKNCLQLNVAKGKLFSDIGLYSGVAATDWSWSTLMADYNLDGYSDIFITNGIKHRLNDLDFIKFIAADQPNTAARNLPANDKSKLSQMPDGAWHNYAYSGHADMLFQDESEAWGFTTPTYSSGATYADLDGDGDLDLVVNNMNEPAGIFKNNTLADSTTNFLNIQLQSNTNNRFGLGAKLFAFCKGVIYHQELQVSHGFLSASEPLIHFGFGANTIVDSLFIIWPNNKIKKIIGLKTNQKLILKNESSTDSIANVQAFIAQLILPKQEPIFTDITSTIHLAYQHKENIGFVDFNRQWLIPHELSTAGPKLAVADVDGNGLDDFFVCGAKEQAGKLFVQNAAGNFTPTNDILFSADSSSEDVDALFLDVDNDGDKDLYVASGGNEFFGNDEHLKDRLYINNGKGLFSKSLALPALYENKSCVAAADIDGDGDMDLFVGGRANSLVYGEVPTSYLLINNGKGIFTIANDSAAPGLGKIGMVTAASFADIDGDGKQDLIVVGEWMPPTIFKNDGQQLIAMPTTKNENGWWTSIHIADMNGDGKPDFLLGNYGLNAKLKATENEPVSLYLADVDNNQTKEQILVVNKAGKNYPFVNKEDLEKQLPYLKKEFLSYRKMADKTVEEIFGNKIAGSKKWVANNFSSQIWINKGGFQFNNIGLPMQFQWAPIYSFFTTDFNKDGRWDVLAGGNFYGVTPYEGRYDAMLPTLAFSNRGGNFTTACPTENALQIGGEMRDIKPIKLAGKGSAIIVARNNNSLLFLTYK